MAVPHPIPYQGSKRWLAQQILAYFPDGNPRLFEPFAGSAAISLAALSAGLVRHVFLSDSDPALIALWQAILTNPGELADNYRALWVAQIGHERDFYSMVRARFNRTHHPADFLYLLLRCVKAAVRYNSQGEFNQSQDNRRKGTHPKTITNRLMEAHLLLSGRVTVTCDDYRAALQMATPADLVYLDPPYQGVGGSRDSRYREQLIFSEFVETLESLNQRGIAYLVSYDGRTGSKQHGRPLPESLKLRHIEIDAGRSSQATLLGQVAITYESLYLSSSLIARLDGHITLRHPRQLSLIPA